MFTKITEYNNTEMYLKNVYNFKSQIIVTNNNIN